MIQPLLGELIEVRLLLDPKLGQVVADSSQIDQILMNLAANARDAMPQGGSLTIETRNIEIDRRGRNPDADVPPGAYVMLTVADTGTGMDAETLQHVFEPFFTTKERGGGSGLGLATVYGIVKQNGGWIDVHSEPEDGTAFHIFLPQVSGTKEISSNAEAPAATAGAAEVLLIVEDQDDVRKFAVEVLQARGYAVLSAADGESALALVESHPEPIQLLVTDVVLPGMNGRQLALRLKAVRPGMLVLYTSGYTRDVIAEHCVLEPDTVYIPKPYTPGDLAAKVRELLANKPDPSR